MSKYRFNETKEFAFGDLTGSINVIPESGASFNVSYWTGSEWVLDEKSPVSNPANFIIQSTNVKIEPLSGFVFVTGAGTF